MIGTKYNPTSKRGKQPFKRPCKRCEKLFNPSTRTTKLCNECRDAAINRARGHWKEKRGKKYDATR